MRQGYLINIYSLERNLFMKIFVRLLSLFVIFAFMGCAKGEMNDFWKRQMGSPDDLAKPGTRTVRKSTSGSSGGFFSTPKFMKGEKGVKITKPATASTVRGSFEVCMDIGGFTVEPAKNGVNEGKGHHHLLVDVPVPSDLSQPIAKDENHIHMGDGSKCKTLNLSPGIHTITALFARGNHVPYDPPVKDTIFVEVRGNF